MLLFAVKVAVSARKSTVFHVVDCRYEDMFKGFGVHM